MIPPISPRTPPASKVYVPRDTGPRGKSNGIIPSTIGSESPNIFSTHAGASTTSKAPRIMRTPTKITKIDPIIANTRLFIPII